jgi:tRNA G18 (ribose-2'-O)-methylase SpoU
MRHKNPSGIASVVKKNNLEIKDKDIINNGFYIILEGVSDPEM